MTISKRYTFGFVLFLAALACTNSTPPAPPTSPPSAPPKLKIPDGVPDGGKVSLDTNELLFFAGGGGPYDDCSFEELGQIHLTYWGEDRADVENGRLCFQNVEGENPKLSLYFPNGVLAADSESSYHPNQGIDLDETSVAFDLWLPATIPDGPWRAVLTTDGEQREFTFTLDQPIITIVTQNDGDVIHPLLKNPKDTPINVQTGESLLIRGARFAPNTTVNLTVFRRIDRIELGEEPIDGANIETIQASVDSEGGFWVSLPISEAYQNGAFSIQTEPNAKPADFVYFWDYLTTFTVQGAADAWAPCGDSFQSRLRVGDFARVNDEPPFPNLVQSAPVFDTEIVGEIQPGDGTYLLAGPACEENIVWWYVLAEDGSSTGWTTEGGEGEYWLVPGE